MTIMPVENESYAGCPFILSREVRVFRMSESLRLMQFNPAWKQEFEQARSSILQATDGWVADCQHVGATALEGSIAAPVIDLAAGLRELSRLNEVAALVEGLNYRRRETPSWCDEELVAYLEKPRSGQPTHSILIVALDGPAWVRMLQHRQQLSASEELKETLGTLKRKLYVTGCSAATNYESAKQAFFSKLDQL
ncbi:MAG: GrpB family protein [Aureliella sp.]